MPCVSDEIRRRLKNTPEQRLVVGPIVQYLVDLGWGVGQMAFGKKEWRVPKSPSAASERAKGDKTQGFPVDIAVFESEQKAKQLDYTGLRFIVECKQPNDSEGLRQLDIYLGLEPHARLGIWANTADRSAECVFLFKDDKGTTHAQKRHVKDFPTPGFSLDKDHIPRLWSALITPTQETFIKKLEELLGHIVARDSLITRREEQLDQLCNIILLKLDSDKNAKLLPDVPVAFREMENQTTTAEHIRTSFTKFAERFKDIYTDEDDKRLRFNDSTIAQCVDDLAPLKLLDLGPSVVSVAFQVLRSAALKQEEGQYFTPQPVIEAAVRHVGVRADDLILDPACGTGGFLVECMMEMRRNVEKSNGDKGTISGWAQKALYGIDKDAIAIKLTKAVMQILGDGSAHCARGDSVLTNRWVADYQHLLTEFQNGRFTLIFTNPPFGAPLTVKRSDAAAAGLSIIDNIPDEKIELGLAMFDRCHQLLADGGKLCIVLPETYFFSPSFKFVREWCDRRFKPLTVINIPMDAFQGFCRAKTNLYVFEKRPGALVSGCSGDPVAQLETAKSEEVLFMNPRTCGIYKNGGTRFKVDEHGQRTAEIDNEMLEHVLAHKGGNPLAGSVYIPLAATLKKDVLVPAYYDPRWGVAFDNLLVTIGCGETTLGELLGAGLIEIRSGHGSPGNDQRVGNVPYVKVSDIRSLRINTNPTNMIPVKLAEKLWKSKSSGLKAWDLITPNRASSNIGEFAVLLPGEENIVLTREVFVVRVTDKGQKLLDPHFLLWAFSLKAVRDQWRRIALMQTNREDVGNRHLEIRLPMPVSKTWADRMSVAFRDYFCGIANAKGRFLAAMKGDLLQYIGSVSSEMSPQAENDGGENTAAVKRKPPRQEP